MTLVKYHATLRKLAANRANSRKSTGPRSALGKLRAARNSGRYFIFGQVTPSRMEELGEEPAEFERLRQSLRSAISPRDGFEELLVEEMAVNRWRLGRLRRAETGTLVGERLGLLAGKYRMETGEANVDNPSLEMFGLVGAKNSPQKFSQILELLGILSEKVKAEGFTKQGLKLLRTIYGDFPGLPGTALIAKFESEMRENSDGEDEVDEQGEDGAQADDEHESDDNDSTAPEATDEQPEPGPAPAGERLGDEDLEAAPAAPAYDSGEQGEAAQVEPPRLSSKAERQAEARRNFLDSLERDAKSFAQLAVTEAVIRETPIPQAAVDARMIPFRDNMDQMLRYETMLQHEFERLQKQLRDWRESRLQAGPGDCAGEKRGRGRRSPD